MRRLIRFSGAVLLRAFALALLLATIAGHAMRAQSPVPGAPSAPRPGVSPSSPGTTGDPALAKAPTAIIRGRVIAAGTNLPIRGVQIRLTAFMPTPNSRETRLVATDEQGRYEILNLPAGRFTIAASRTGYVSRSYGQGVASDAAPQPVELADAQALDRIDIILPRGSVVSVTVVDATGEPLAGVQVDVLRTMFLNGQRSLSPAGTAAETNDLGQTRIHGLMPGQYYVSARSGFAALSGGRDAYAPTFYPGTMVARDAERISLGSAQELQLVIPAVTAKQARISGTVRRSDGSPITESASPMQPGIRGGFTVGLRQETPGNGYTERSVSVRPDGSFTVADVLPGDYTIQVRPATTTVAPGAPAAQTPIVREFARVPITVDGVDIASLSITTQKGATIRGQLSFDTGTAPADTAPNTLRVATYYTGTEQPISAGTTTMNDDWSFAIEGVVATGLLRLSSTTTGWSTKSVIVDGKDVTETPMNFEPGRGSKDVQVTLTQKRAEVSGAVVDAQNRPTSEFVAVLFPEDKSLWFARSRLIVAGRPDQNGQFKISQLPEGRFLIAAVPTLANGEEQDLELLARLAPRATSVLLADGEMKTLGLKLVEAR